MAFPSFLELAKSTLTYKKPSANDAARHARGLELVADLYESLNTTGDNEYAHVGLCIDNFVELLHTHDTGAVAVFDTKMTCPEGTEVVRILGRIRMCANRFAGARSVTGDQEDWCTAMHRELMLLELAVASAIVATPTED